MNTHQREFSCFNLKQERDRVSFYIYKEKIGDIQKAQLCVKKRREELFFSLKYIIREIDEYYYFEMSLEQFSNICKQQSRLDLFITEDSESVARLSLDTPRPKAPYLDIFDLDSQLSISCYCAKNRGISFLVSPKQKILNEAFKGNVNLKSIRFNGNGKTRLIVCIENTQEIDIENLVLRKRKSIDDESIELAPRKIKVGKPNTEIIFEFQVKDIQWSQFYWDAFLKIKDTNNNEIYIRIKNMRLRNKIKMQGSRRTCELEDNYIIYPYITLSGELSFSYRLKGSYEATKYIWNERIAVILYLLFGWIYRLQNIWLVHEKYAETAQDNGFYFFRYAYEHKYRQKVYFVIKKESPDYRFVKPMKSRVVEFMSIKHLFLLLACSKIVASESKGHGYAWRVSRGWIKPAMNHKTFIFLQHGVLGLKKIDNTFAAKGMNRASLFVTSSNFEREIVKQYFGYSEDEVIVTGLARWDNLHGKITASAGNNILFMPTWRNWLEEVTDDEFLDSEYFKVYSSLMKSQVLNDWLTKNDTTLNFYIHPKFAQFMSHFKTTSDKINIIFFGEQPLNQLLMEAKLLITDYSSIAFEAFYQNKATLFFQFDRKKYLELQGSYMDLEKELFGPSACDEEELLEMLDDMYKSGFAIQESHKPLKDYYFHYCDDCNSERISDSIVQWEQSRVRNLGRLYYLKCNPFVQVLRKKIKKVRSYL